MKIKYIIIVILILLGLFFISMPIENYLNNKFKNLDPKELTINQTLGLIELGAIDIHTDIEYTDGDQSIDIVAKTINGDCYIY